MSNAAKPVDNKEIAETAHPVGASTLPDDVNSGPQVFKPKLVTEGHIASARALLVTDNQFLMSLRTKR